MAFFKELLSKTGTGIKGLEKQETKYSEKDFPDELNEETKSKLLKIPKIDVFTKHSKFF